jgi:hypothetical protein
MQTIQELNIIIDDLNAALTVLTKEVEDYANVLEYASNKPGLAEQLEVARLYPGKFTGMVNLWEMVEMCGADLSDDEYRAVNNGMRIVLGTQCHRLPEEHEVYLEDGEAVSSILYPMDMIPVLRSMLKYGGFID